MSQLAKQTNQPIRIGVLCSSCGGVLDALCKIQQNGKWPYQIAGVVTDRECGAELIAAKHGVPLKRVPAAPDLNWSNDAALILNNWKLDAALLLIMRKVGPAVWRDLNIPVLNLHPSLLPAYRGANALERNHADAMIAKRHGDEIRMGVTIHIVTEELDAGPVVSQRYFTIDDAPTIDQAQHICYLYKVALMLECVCKLIDRTLPTWHDAGDPRPWHERYAHWKPYEPMTDVMSNLAQPWASEWMRPQVHVNAVRLAARVLHA